MTSSPPLNAVANSLYQYDIEANDAENDTFVFEVVEVPDGVALDSRTGSLRWRPTEDQAGLQTMEIRVISIPWEPPIPSALWSL